VHLFPAHAVRRSSAVAIGVVALALAQPALADTGDRSPAPIERAAVRLHDSARPTAHKGRATARRKHSRHARRKHSRHTRRTRRSRARLSISGRKPGGPKLSPPRPKNLPAISGTAQEGQTLSASTGIWSGAPTSYDFQWLRCSSVGSSCTGVSGATLSMYGLGGDDVGSTMRVRVTATNSYGSASATSAQTAVVTAADAPAPTPPPASDPSGEESKLTWAPPALTNPITVTIEDIGQACPSVTSVYQNPTQPQVCFLDKAKDYIVKLNHRHTGPIAGLTINGGHNVVVIGGRITVDLALTPDAPDSVYRRSLTFRDQTGTVHLEGVLLDGEPQTCLNLDSNVVFQIQNVRCVGTYLWHHNFNNPHSSNMITWKSPTEVRLDRNTFEYDNTGLALYTSTTGTYPGRVIIKRTNMRNASYASSHLAIARRSTQTRLDVDRLYMETGWGYQCWCEWSPLGSFQFTLTGAFSNPEAGQGPATTMVQVGDGKGAGSYIEFTKPEIDNVWGVNGAYARILYGIPPGGDFAPAGLAGEGYVPPGYLN
jgi:hypothetical protein